MWELYGYAAITVVAIVTVLWIVSVALQDASIIDLFWGPLFVAMAWVLLAIELDHAAPKHLLFVFLVTAWGLRLAFHLTARNVGHGEDVRYRAWRSHGGKNWWLKTYYRVYLLQGTIALVVATPVIACFAGPPRMSIINWIGVAVCIAGMTTEAMSDIQLTRFKAEPSSAGQVMDKGLWYYSRHPNYFGDAVMWWGLGIATFSGPTWWSLVGPLAMTLVFLNLSQDVIERGLKRRRPDYVYYIERTSAFFPLRPSARMTAPPTPDTSRGRESS